jgi:hypothetical protein
MEHVRCQRWAEQEWGKANLGDPRRTRRLVLVGAGAASNPAGKITEIFSRSADREGAFRFLENTKVPAEEIAHAAHVAAAQRCFGQSFVFVPTDGSSLHITDTEAKKGLGIVGSRKVGARGLCVMTAIGILRDGTPIGVLGQEFWARTEPSPAKKKDRRPVEQKETRYWLEVMEQVRKSLGDKDHSPKPWFQVDRGADAWPVLMAALEKGDLLTVRAAYDRRLEAQFQGKRDYLWSRLTRQKVGGYYTLQVPGGLHRRERTAWMQLKWSTVVLDLMDVRTKKHFAAPVWAVHVKEIKTVPAGEQAIEWMLLTTHPVKTVEDAQLVLDGYATRWRIEEFHKIWKTGACRVEQTQLRAVDHIERWATIMASVAMRILRLTYIGRTQPEASATLELTPAEIHAVFLLRKPAEMSLKKTPTMEQVVLWIAELGGYTGKSSGGPPGPLVLARGLRKVEILAAVLDENEKM